MRFHPVASSLGIGSCMREMGLKVDFRVGVAPHSDPEQKWPQNKIQGSWDLAAASSQMLWKDWGFIPGSFFSLAHEQLLPLRFCSLPTSFDINCSLLKSPRHGF